MLNLFQQSIRQRFQSQAFLESQIFFQELNGAAVKHSAALPKSGILGVTDSFSGAEWCGSTGTYLFTETYSESITGKSACAGKHSVCRRF